MTDPAVLSRLPAGVIAEGDGVMIRARPGPLKEQTGWLTRGAGRW